VRTVTFHRVSLGLIAAGWLAAAGCADDLPRASEIKAMRALGARTEVEGDPQRSSPKPGETAHINWNIAFPKLDQDEGEIAALFTTCTAPTRFTGVPVCQELLDATESSKLVEVLSAAGGLRSAQDCAQNPDQRVSAGPFALTCVTGSPHLDVKIENDFKAAAKLIQGIICRNGTPMLDASDPTGMHCRPLPGIKANRAESLPVYGTVPVQYSKDDANTNPNLDAARFAFGPGEAEWPALPPDESASLLDDCSQASVDQQLLSSSGKDDELVIEYDASARELHKGMPETLEFSTYVTFGQLDRRFTVFAPDTKPPFKDTLKWNVPKDARDKLGDRSKLVRFYFTLLDHRGGFSVTSREVCVGRNLAKNAQD
jgi:hypothetical protein